jgi:hypothetical protein
MTRQETTMRRAGAALFGLGVLFALAALPLLHPVLHIFLQLAYWPFHDVPQDIGVPAQLLVAIGGGLTAGFGAMMWALGTHVAPRAPEAAARVTWIAAWTWFCTDSFGSVLVGAPFNVVLNVGILALMLVACRTQSENVERAA